MHKRTTLLLVALLALTPTLFAQQATRVVTPNGTNTGDNTAGANKVKNVNGAGTETGTASVPFRVDPTGTTAQPVTDNGATLSVDDGGGSLTVDGTITCTNCSGTGVAVNEDVASANADPGTPAYTVRQDSITGGTSADGDYQPAKSDSAGRLYVTGSGGSFPVTDSGGSLTVDGTVTVTDGAGALNVIVDSGAITATVSDGAGALNVIVDSGALTVSDGSGALNVICDSGCSGGSQYAEDAAHVSGDSFTMAGAIRRDTTPSSSSGTAGDVSALNVDANGRLYVNATLYDASGSALSTDTQMVWGGAGTFTAGTAPTGSWGNPCRVSAAAPSTTGVADDDWIMPWCSNVGAMRWETVYGSTVAAAGSGTISAGTARVTIATDDPVNDALVKLDGAISGTEVQVDVVGALPAGDNDIGNVDLELAGTAVGATNPIPVRISNGAAVVSQRCADDSKVNSVVISTASSGNTELVALTSTQVVYVCGYDIVATGAVSFQFIYGTGTACATGETDLTGAMPFAANGGISRPNGGAVQFKGAASNALCMELSAGVQVDGVLTYVKE